MIDNGTIFEELARPIMRFGTFAIDFREHFVDHLLEFTGTSRWGIFEEGRGYFDKQ